MKHNRILSVIAFAGILCAASSCGDGFLTVDNPTAAPIEDYFTTEPHLQEALVAAYAPLHWTDWNGSQYNPLMIMSDIMADQIWVGGNDKTDNQFWHMMMNYEATSEQTMKGIWSTAYSGVKRCNDLLTYLGWTEGLSEETAKAS